MWASPGQASALQFGKVICKVALSRSGSSDAPQVRFKAARRNSAVRAAQHFQNMPREMFLDLAVPGHGLRGLRERIVIPVVSSTVADEDRPEFLNLSDEVAMLHDTSNSA